MSCFSWTCLLPSCIAGPEPFSCLPRPHIFRSKALLKVSRHGQWSPTPDTCFITESVLCRSPKNKKALNRIFADNSKPKILALIPEVKPSCLPAEMSALHPNLLFLPHQSSIPWAV